MKIYFKLSAFFIFLAAAQLNFGQTKAEKISGLLDRYYDYGLFNGTILAAQNGEIVFENGYGFANMEFKVPNKPDTKFRIGSISKQFTAAIILQLVDEGKINLDGKITDYLKNYRKDTGDKVTIHHLLTHTSGILSYTNMPNVWTDSLRNHYDKDYFIEHFHSGDLEFEPGSEFRYNNTGYYLLAAIAEEVTGESFSDLLKKRILEPAGMMNSGSEVQEIVVDKLSDGYMKRGNVFWRDPYIFMPNAMGAGQMYSTVGDLFKWDRILYTDKILSAEMKNKMFTPFLSNYGYGWAVLKSVDDATGDTVVITTHSGGINGFNTLEVRDTSRKLFVAVFSNAGGAPLDAIAQNIGKILLDKDYDFPKRPISEYLYEQIADEGIDAAIELYRELKESESATFDFSEGQLNLLGYTLMREDRYEEALKIFMLNIEMFPNSGNVYDSAAEAFAKLGNNDKAIEYYKKSLDINPANENAIEKLKELGIDYEKAEVNVSPETFELYSGDYQLMENFIITIRSDGNQLFAKATSQPEFEIFPLSETKFFYKVVNAQIKFVIENKKPSELILFQSGREMHAKKIK